MHGLEHFINPIKQCPILVNQEALKSCAFEETQHNALGEFTFYWKCKGVMSNWDVATTSPSNSQEWLNHSEMAKPLCYQLHCFNLSDDFCKKCGMGSGCIII